jgi:K+-sensing histidine kinase KdpD
MTWLSSGFQTFDTSTALLANMMAFSIQFSRGIWLVCMALFIILLYILPYLAKRAAMSREMEIEDRIRAHTAQLQKELDLSRSREAGLRRNDMLRSLAMASISHDVRSPLKFITKLAGEMGVLIEQNEMERLAEAGQVIAYTGERIFHLADAMSEFFKTTVRDATIQTEEINLSALVEEKISTFSGMLSIHGGHITADIFRNTVVHTHARLLGIVVHNAIDNAIKARAANQISIYTHEESNALHLIIADAGPGMPDHILTIINTVIGQNDLATAGADSGLGMTLMREICNLLHLGLHAVNSPGAHVHIIFNAGQYHTDQNPGSTTAP